MNAPPSWYGLGALLLAWVAYFAVHSLLATDCVKRVASRRMRSVAHRYRLLYNVVAVLTLAPVLALLTVLRGPLLWPRPPPAGLLLDALAAAAVVLFVSTLRHHDMRRFSGLRGGRDALDDGTALTVSGLGRAVRHPWYALALVLIWSRPMDAAWLLSSACITAYIVVGARIEERRLTARFGPAYAEYRRRVGFLLPWPGRILSPAEALELEQRARTYAGAGVNAATPCS